MIQWLELCTSTAGGIGSVSGQGTKIPQSRSTVKNKQTKQKKGSYNNLKSI